MNDEEIKEKCAHALELTYTILEDAYGTIPEPKELKDRNESFKIILKYILELI